MDPITIITAAAAASKVAVELIDLARRIINGQEPTEADLLRVAAARKLAEEHWANLSTNAHG